MRIHIDYRAERFIDVFEGAYLPGQINVSIINPGITCAFHKHKEQTDYWLVLKGRLEVIVVEDKKGSKEETYILQNCYMYNSTVPDCNHRSPLVIRPNYWHGYRCIGNERAILLYYVSSEYDNNNPDEQRITPKKLGIEFSNDIK